MRKFISRCFEGTALYLLSAGVAASVFLAVSGCTTTSTSSTGVSPLNITNVCNIVEQVGKPLMPLAIQQCPDCRTWFSLSAQIINLALANGNYDPAVLATNIANAKVKEIQSPQADALIQAVLGLYNIYAGQVVAQKLNSVTYLVPVLTTIRDLLQAGATASITQPGNGYNWVTGNLVLPAHNIIYGDMSESESPFPAFKSFPPGAAGFIVPDNSTVKLVNNVLTVINPDVEKAKRNWGDTLVICPGNLESAEHPVVHMPMSSEDLRAHPIGVVLN